MSAARLAALAVALGSLAAPGWGLVTAERLLLDGLRAAGLERVEPIAAGAPMARGSLPGDGALTVLLFAGCGPGGQASRHGALIAVADLARTPRRHTLEVVACGAGGPGPGMAGSAAGRWLEDHPSSSARDAVLAALHLELDDRGDGRARGLLEGADGPAGRRLTPAWLAHAALAGARAAGQRLAIGDRGWPLMGQLVGRYGRSRSATGAAPFLAAGIPALTLVGGGEPGWPAIVTATVRRLDSLAGRPRDDDEFLALAGRVWSRRDLYWLGLAIWVALIAGGLPGAWRGAGGGARRRRGRLYLPGFALRMLFLVGLLLAPATTLVLLAPAALLTLAPLVRPPAVLAGRALAAAPAVLLAGSWAAALAAGRLAAWPAQPLRLALVMAAVALAIGLVGGRRGGREPDAGSPA